jgi:hypothetical protein
MESQESQLPPLAPHDYTGTCWWCGAQANSREHRHKASDLRREFAKQEYAAGEVIVSRGEEKIPVQGPNSAKVKFGDVFCARCNNERSQPFDLAYDRLMKWFLANEQSVEATGVIRLEEIDRNWQGEAGNVLRYFVKHIGCRVAEAGYTVPPALAEFLDGGDYPDGLICSLEIDGAFGAINWILTNNPSEHGTSGNLGLGPITGEIGREDRHASVLRGHTIYHSLQMVWEWSTDPTRTGTNLSAAVFRAPLVRQKEGRALRRASSRIGQPGMAGKLWSVFHRTLNALGLHPAKLHRDRTKYEDLTDKGEK